MGMFGVHTAAVCNEAGHTCLHGGADRHEASKLGHVGQQSLVSARQVHAGNEGEVPEGSPEKPMEKEVLVGSEDTIHTDLSVP